MNKKVLLLSFAFVLIFQNLIAQSNTSSPYSRYGFGDLANTFGLFQSLGGSSIGVRNNLQLNFNNPASFTVLDTLSFTWEFGVNGGVRNYQTIDKSVSKFNANFSYMGGGFQINRWWYAGFALMPYSSVGYEIRKDSAYTSPWDETIKSQTFYNGNGGVNQVFLTNAFKLSKSISLGVNIKYLFGSIDHTRIINYLDDEGSIDNNFFSTKYVDKIVVSDFTYDFGLQFSNSIKEDLKYTIGATFANESNIKAINNHFATSANSFGLVDTILNIDDEKDNIVIPTIYGVGISLHNNKFLFVADYSKQLWSESTFLGKKDSLADMSKLSVGLDYVPNSRSVHYMSRIHYRIGFHHTNTYLDLKGEQLQEIGIGFGFGLPVNRGRSHVNLSFELGQRGTTDNNLIKENYALLSLSLSLHDIWFVKRKFN